MNSAFLYKWTELSTGKWYIGSRTARNCHPNDGYITSSKSVKPLILANPNDWQRTIIEMGEPRYIRALESELLEFIDAKNLSQSYNKNNGHVKFSNVGGTSWSKGKTFSEEHKKKIGAKHKGLNKPKSPEWCKKHSERMRGENNPQYKSIRSAQHRQRLSESNKGKTLSLETRRKISETKKRKRASYPALDLVSLIETII